MWISRKLTYVVTTTSNTVEEEQQQKAFNFHNRASALIDRFNKPLPPILGGGFSNQHQHVIFTALFLQLIFTRKITK
jgi:hypothetical protein